MKNKRNMLFCLIILLAGVICFPVQAQQKDAKSVITSTGPKWITRNIIQDRKGNIWIAAWDGVFQYDGKSFTNIINKVSSARFFSVLEDRKGNLWFGSIGSGVYCYDARLPEGQGKSLPTGQAGIINFTTKEGLASNDISCIYEDKSGNIWFGTGNGVSCYDGKSFRNFTARDGLFDRDINSIIEDKKGKFWFATRGNTYVYDARLPDGQGKAFAVFKHKGKPFTNVRSIIEDKKGNIWLGGNDGLWCYNGSTFINFTQKFVGYVIEDREGNIWTTAERDNSKAGAFSKDDGSYLPNGSLALSRYDGKTLSGGKPVVTEITAGRKLLFGILEANDGSIWFGASDGVYRYDGHIITNFNSTDTNLLIKP